MFLHYISGDGDCLHTCCPYTTLVVMATVYINNVLTLH
jgi:hypothetical protein